MAEKVSIQNAVVLRGTVGVHFSDEVLSWLHVKGQPGEEILPAILITTRNPHEFHERCFRNIQNSKVEDMIITLYCFTAWVNLLNLALSNII
ncbi:MAG: hypothetical protein K9L78_00645 [Victivallales bacterium]|nr:hypothetical protein [Victivallales bacterium]MCF7888604.1 hypothetical protein [Victivallales bacterium]